MHKLPIPEKYTLLLFMDFKEGKKVKIQMSFITNALIIYVFQTSLRLRRQNYANPVILAIFDMLGKFFKVLSFI